jgi:glycolate oxidase FAD binding subunit
LREIEARLAAAHQMLAFEPPDFGPLYGQPPGQATLGGIIACNLSGPRRVRAGAARDFILGCTVVNGTGETVKAGGRVVKNVTGYDLSKLMAGSFGTLGVLAEATIKVLPAPEAARTLCLGGLDDAAAVALMNKALGGAQDVSAAAHLPTPIAQGASLGSESATLLRLEGTVISVEHRLAKLREECGGKGRVLADGDAATLWRSVRDASFFAEDRGDALWRISLPPAASPALTREFANAPYFYDWGGGLVWLSLPAQGDGRAASLRASVAAIGGHATLVRGPLALRAAIDVFQPMEPALAALTRRVKESFDPMMRLNPGRMYRDV